MDILNADAGVLLTGWLVWRGKFSHSEYINKQIYRYWSDEQPCEVLRKPLNNLKVTAWIGMSTLKVLEVTALEKTTAQ
jgi:hypothetical protein